MQVNSETYNQLDVLPVRVKTRVYAAISTVKLPYIRRQVGNPAKRRSVISE